MMTNFFSICLDQITCQQSR